MYAIRRFAKVGDKAFLEFDDPNDVEALGFVFGGDEEMFSCLGNAFLFRKC